jgi:hypothetical protein
LGTAVVVAMYLPREGNRRIRGGKNTVILMREGRE